MSRNEHFQAGAGKQPPGRYTTVSAHHDPKSKTVDEYGQPYKVKRVQHDTWEDAQEYAAANTPWTDGKMLPNLPPKVEQAHEKKGLERQTGHTFNGNNVHAVTYKHPDVDSKYRD